MKAKLLKKIRAKYHIGIVDYPKFEIYNRYVIVSKNPAEIGKDTINKDFGHIYDFFLAMDIPCVDIQSLYVHNRDRKLKEWRRSLSEKERLVTIEKLESRYENKTTEEVEKNI